VNGAVESYTYDLGDKMLTAGATVLRTMGCAWDNADQITSQTVNEKQKAILKRVYPDLDYRTIEAGE
jgi:hypothetical protein